MSLDLSRGTFYLRKYVQKFTDQYGQKWVDPIDFMSNLFLYRILIIDFDFYARIIIMKLSIYTIIKSSSVFIGKANRVPASPSSETSKQLNHNLPANVSATIQVHATLTTPMSQTSMRTGFSTASTGVPMGSRQYILASDMRQIYSAPLSNTPKKPITAGRVQVLRPDTTLSSKTAPSTAALVAGNKCQLSGQPI